VVVSVTDPDGGESNDWNFEVTVNAFNDLPVITGQNTTPSTNEETPIAINIAHLNVTDADNPGFPTGFSLNVKAGTGYTASGTTVTPNDNVTGPINVVVSVTDPDGGESNAWNFEVTVNSVNDLPVITGQNTTPSTNEETPIAINIAHLNVTDADNLGFPAGFSLNVKPGTGYTASGTTVTPNDEVSGTIEVVVSVSDPDGGESNDWNFEVTVNSVNDLPVITGQNTTPSTNEETPIAIHTAHLNVTDADNPGFPAGFSLNVKPGTGYTAAGTTITPNANVEGTINVVVSVTDPDGGESADFNFEVTVTGINDAPVITGQNTIPSTNEETPIV